MKKAQSSTLLRLPTSRVFVSLAALALLVPAAPGQEQPNQRVETRVDGKPSNAFTPSVAQIEESVERAESLLKAGDRIGARAACEEASALAALDKATPEWLAVAHGVLWRMGLAAYQSGDLDVTHAAWQALLRHRESTLTDDHPDLQSARSNLAVTKFTLRDLAGALELEEKVLAVQLATLPAEHVDLQKARGNLANTKYALGDFAGAQALQEKMLAVFSATLPDDHPYLQAARGNLAMTKYALGDSAGAQVLREKVLAVQLATLPDDHPDLQSARGNLAKIKRKLGDLAGALVLEEKVLAVQLVTLPDDHPDLQSARGNLANTKYARGD